MPAASNPDPRLALVAGARTSTRTVMAGRLPSGGRFLGTDDQDKIAPRRKRPEETSQTIDTSQVGA
jgi:hypothetical protein